MRRALRPNKNRVQRAQIGAIPPPTGGWNARDALSAMKPNDAISLTNWVADIGRVGIRPGYSSWVTGLTSAVESLMEYSAPTGSNKLFAAAGTSVFDVTTTGAVGAAVLSGMGNARWQHTMFGAGANNYLVMCNGVNGVRTYDGTTWVDRSASITGATAANFINVTAHMSRLWFVEKNSLKVWYLPISAVAGAASSLDLTPLCKRGGYLLAMASWTHDGGSGPDDYAVFITSNGELILFSGTDPSSSSTAALVGTFKIPEPIGKRCWMKAGGDLAFLTSQGLLLMSQAMGVNESGAAAGAFTNKIDGAFRDAYSGYSLNFGWQVFQYPKRNLAIINVPVQEGSLQEQYVMNVKTGSWSRFTGMNAASWSLMGDALFFGDNSGTVWKFDGTNTDNGVPITATMQTAFVSLGGLTNKRFTNAKTYFTAPLDGNPLVYAKIDYDTSEGGITLAALGTGVGTLWDVSFWDAPYWADDATQNDKWQALAGYGQTISLAFGVSSPSPVFFNGSEIMYEVGGPF
jgi:hypothetical protein